MDEHLAVDGEREADAEGPVEGDHVLVQIHPGQRPRLFELPGHGDGDAPSPTPGPTLRGCSPMGGAEGSCRTAWGEEEGGGGREEEAVVVERSGHGDGRERVVWEGRMMGVCACVRERAFISFHGGWRRRLPSSHHRFLSSFPSFFSSLIF